MSTNTVLFFIFVSLFSLQAATFIVYKWHDYQIRILRHDLEKLRKEIK